MIADEKAIKAFARCHTAIQQAANVASEMAGPDGAPTNLCGCRVHTLKWLLREANCAANALDATHDGRRL